MALGACSMEEMSSLREFSRSYAGEYECVEATLGGRDLLKYFRYVILFLNRDGTFTVSARTKTGIEGAKAGSYECDTEKGEILLRAERGGKTYEKRCAYVNGSFAVSHSFNGRELVLKFRMKG